jgi:creatinine amidohydrolase
MQLSQMSWTLVETYLKSKKTIIVPIGSTEQHGPTGLIGTDYTTAEQIAYAVGEKTNTLVSPPLCFGMAYHHMAFPGTMTLKPSTMILVLMDLMESLYTHGFQNIFFINGHGGNINPTTTAFCEFKTVDREVNLFLENWWRLKEVQDYEQIHFGKENGFHATCGEVAVTMHLHPNAFASMPKVNFEMSYPDYNMPLAPKEFRKIFPDGRMHSNPNLATKDHGKIIFDLAVNSLAKKVHALT